jgi:hypothetical protein
MGCQMCTCNDGLRMSSAIFGFTLSHIHSPDWTEQTLWIICEKNQVRLSRAKMFVVQCISEIWAQA